MFKLEQVPCKRLLGAGFLASSLAVPVACHAQAWLLPDYKDCLAAAERGGAGAPTVSECRWRYQEERRAFGQ